MASISTQTTCGRFRGNNWSCTSRAMDISFSSLCRCFCSSINRLIEFVMLLNDSPRAPNWSFRSTRTRCERFPPWTNCVALYRSLTVRVIARVCTPPITAATISINRKIAAISSSSNTFAPLSSPIEAKILRFSSDRRARKNANTGCSRSTVPSSPR